jgi:large repetitive protein
VTPSIQSFTPASGPLGTPVIITGVSLKQATSVTFGGVKATTFVANSDAQVTPNVPTGGKTDKIGIAPPGGTATSPTTFSVTP